MEGPGPSLRAWIVRCKHSDAATVTGVALTHKKSLRLAVAEYEERTARFPSGGRYGQHLGRDAFVQRLFSV